MTYSTTKQFIYFLQTKYDNKWIILLTMKRIYYIQSLTTFLQSNQEILLQQLLPQELLNEIYYFQRFQQKLLQT
jgi:hypothetical protein